jgi:hypothetical protein
MDEHTYNNWVKVKKTFEESGNTNNMFYTRACAIVSGGADPLDKILGKPVYESSNERDQT